MVFAGAGHPPVMVVSPEHGARRPAECDWRRALD
jgi:hypothetical protein